MSRGLETFFGTDALSAESNLIQAFSAFLVAAYLAFRRARIRDFFSIATQTVKHLPSLTMMLLLFEGRGKATFNLNIIYL